jgi:hypothetical protein
MTRLLTVSAAVALIAATGSVASTASTSPTAQSGTLWAIFLDDLHVDFRSTGYLRTLLRTICTDLVHDGDMVALVSTGPSSIAIDLTYDRQSILKGIGKATGSGLAPPDIFRSSQSVSWQPNELPYRIWVSVSTAFDVVERLAHVRNLRKALIYVSSGYHVDLPPDGTPTESGVGPALPRFTSKNVSMASVRGALFGLMAEARRSDVTVFAVDTRRLGNAAGPDETTDRMWWQNYWATSRISLRAISERTGGFAILEEQDLAEGLKRINTTVRN